MRKYRSGPYITKGGGVDVDELKEHGLMDTIVEVPLYKDPNGTGYLYDDLPPGYHMVNHAGQAKDPEWTEKNRGSWNTADNAWLGDDHWNEVQEYKKQWQDAYNRGDKAGMDAAHAAAEKVRHQYGYSGGADGSKYNPVMAHTGDNTTGPGGNRGNGGGGRGNGSFGGGIRGNYDNRYQARIDAIVDAILNRGPFSYDKDKDPLYSQYKESYTRGGQRAQQDTMGQMAARTGGMPSSWAESASQQAYNNYMAELANKVPELEQRAYNRYVDNISMDRADINMLSALEQGDYAKYLDLLAQANRDRDFNYRAHRDQVGDQQWQQQFDYNASRDQIADQRYQDKLLADLQKAQSAGRRPSGGGGSTAEEPTVPTGISEADKQVILSQYPDGKIDEETWTALVGMYGEDALIAAGFSGGGAPTESQSGAYADIQALMNQMIASGARDSKIDEMLKEALDGGQITKAEYRKLLNARR